MYHYVVIKSVFFFLNVLGSFFSMLAISADSSPRERWNYQKKEDRIKHHTIKIKIKSQNRKLNKDPLNKKSEYINNVNKENNKIESVEGSSNIERPGSPRERW